MSAAAAAATHALTWKVATTPGARGDWGTPPAIYQALDREFDFTLDAAAQPGNAKHVEYLTLDTDALRVPWTGQRVFCNPPYGRGMGAWVRKAAREAAENGALVVLLIPARTGNSWFHDIVLPRAEIRFIRGRLGFTLNGVTRKDKRCPFDSMVCIFRPGPPAPNGTAQLLFPFLPRTR